MLFDFWGIEGLGQSLKRLHDKTDRLLNRLEKMMAKIDELQAAVGRNEGAEDSVITLLRGISQLLKDAVASGDPAKIDALIAQVDASTEKLAAAVVENTPSA